MKVLSVRFFSTSKETIKKCVDCKHFIPHIENNKSYIANISYFLPFVHDAVSV